MESWTQNPSLESATRQSFRKPKTRKTLSPTDIGLGAKIKYFSGFFSVCREKRRVECGLRKWILIIFLLPARDFRNFSVSRIAYEVVSRLNLTRQPRQPVQDMRIWLRVIKYFSHNELKPAQRGTKNFLIATLPPRRDFQLPFYWLKAKVNQKHIIRGREQSFSEWWNQFPLGRLVGVVGSEWLNQYAFPHPEATPNDGEEEEWVKRWEEHGADSITLAL